MKYIILGISPLSVIYAKELLAKGEEVFGLDNNMAKVEQHKDDFSHACCTVGDEKGALESYCNPQRNDVALIFFKNDIAASLVACSILIELGVTQIHSVYKNIEHKKLLQKLGVHTDLINDRLLFKSWSIKKKSELKPIIYLDMDGVLADLGKGAKEHPDGDKPEYQAHLDEIPGVFRNLPPVAGAIEAVNKLLESKKYDMYILTTAPWGNPTAWSDKRHWIEDHFGDSFKKKMIISHRKDLLIGDYLIDDREANGAKDFAGLHLHFGKDYENNNAPNKYPAWNSILEELL